MEISSVVRVVFFLLWVNGLPPIVAITIGDRYGYPVDGGRRWFDGRPIFGTHKTLRGITASVLGGIFACPLLGVAWWVAGITALLAMAGDLASSFIKRRTILASGEQVIGLDQLLEALLPLIFLNRHLSLDLAQNLIILFVFVILSFSGSLLLSRIYRRPIPQIYPRVIRSSVRLKEWRACHEPLARWHSWFNLTSFLSNQVFLTWFFKLSGLYAVGKRNALEIRVEEQSFFFPDLPEPFDGFRILFLVDLHLDGLDGLDLRVAETLREIEADLCCLGGDIRMKTYGRSIDSLRKLRSLMPNVNAKGGTLGVLGNHDCIEMLPDFEEAGVVMLVNDSWPIDRDGTRIWVMGVDDPHYYRLHDATQASRTIRKDEFSIFLAHSPEAFKDAAKVEANLYLCGHTHGGQICVVEAVPIITNSRAPRFTAIGRWQYGKMQGYTSRGVAPSSIPIRFNCPGEISIITLRKKLR